MPARPGERHHFAKLNDDKVREIRRLHSTGIDYLTLSNRYGVDQSVIGRVVTRKAWKHVA